MIVKPTDPAYVRRAARLIRSKQGENALTFAIAQLSDERKLVGINLEEFWLAVIRLLLLEETNPPLSEYDQRMISEPPEMRGSSETCH